LLSLFSFGRVQSPTSHAPSHSLGDRITDRWKKADEALAVAVTHRPWPKRVISAFRPVSGIVPSGSQEGSGDEGNHNSDGGLFDSHPEHISSGCNLAFIWSKWMNVYFDERRFRLKDLAGLIFARSESLF
jgi:hypothetical protein